MGINGMTTKKKRKRLIKSTITNRWVFNNLAVVFLLLLVIATALIFVLQNYYYNAARQYLNTKISSVAGVLTQYAQSANSNFSADLRSTMENFSDKEKMELMAINSKGHIILTSSGFPPSSNTSMPDYDEAMTSGNGYWVGRNNGEKIMAVSINISAINMEYNAIRVVTSMSQIDATLRTYNIAIIILCAGILLLLILTGTFFMRSIVKPISVINETTKKFAKGDFSIRIKNKSKDEIGDLCTAINHMADALSTTETMKNEFISSVSHELRTPLTAIKGWAETISLETTDPETMKKGVEVIVNETSRLSDMVEELLDFSRMQSGKFSLQRASMDVLAELGDAVLIYTEKARRENINIIYDEPEMLPFINGDKNKIRQVFINIIDNAIKYSNPGGTVTIKAEAKENNIQITISDTGVGISSSDLPRVKTKFFKANHTRRGSGIGLAVVDEIVNMHGGNLKIESELGVGTTVITTLPAQN